MSPALLLAAASFAPAADVAPVALAYAPAPADNPLKGLVPYRGPADGRFPYAMEFDYLPLSALMTGPDDFDWEPLDALLADVASRGRQTVFRVFLEYPKRTDAIPKFLLDGGLRTTRWRGHGGRIVTPDYSDPRLVAALEAFIAALGARYDGDPRVGYVTAGLLGIWGEWHDYPRTKLWAPKSTQEAVLVAFEKAFRRVPVLLRYPAGEGDSEYVKTAGRPFGYHDDSFAWATRHTGREEDDWFFETRLRDAGLSEVWRRQPVGGEVRPETWGCVFDDPPCTPEGQSFAACRDAVHPTWLMDTGLSREQASPERRERAIDAVRKMGYEFHVATAAVGSVKKTADGKEFAVTLTVRNTGLAPFYHDGWRVRLALLPVGDDDATPVAVTDTDWSLLGLQPGDDPRTWAGAVDPSGVAAGEYRVLVGVPPTFDGGRPLRFANADRDRHADGWLAVGTVTVE